MANPNAEDQRKAAEQKAVEQKAAEQKAAEQKAADERVAAEKAAAEKAAADKERAKGGRSPRLRITSRVDGFRRAGIAHSAAPVEYSPGSFTADEFEALKREPNLVVEVL